MPTGKYEEFGIADVIRRRDDAIRRALNMPPTPTKELVRKTTRSKAKRNNEATVKTAPAKPKKPNHYEFAA